jgi:hypothetical protein
MIQTAVEWLIARFHYEGFIGTFCSEELIKSKREIMIEIINQAKEMEKKQKIDLLTKYHDNLFYIPLKEGEAEAIYNQLNTIEK